MAVSAFTFGPEVQRRLLCGNHNATHTKIEIFHISDADAGRSTHAPASQPNQPPPSPVHWVQRTLDAKNLPSTVHGQSVAIATRDDVCAERREW